MVTNSSCIKHQTTEFNQTILDSQMLQAGLHFYIENERVGGWMRDKLRCTSLVVAYHKQSRLYSLALAGSYSRRRKTEFNLFV